MTIVDTAVYVAGVRAATPDMLDSTYELLREKAGMVWIGLYRPDREEIDSVAREFTFHHLVVEEPVAFSGAEIGCSDDELAPAQLVDQGPVRVRIGDGSRALDSIELVPG